MKEFRIINTDQTNPHYEEKKAIDGGGYHQPLYEFVLGAKAGYLEDTSCGAFGQRIDLVFDGLKIACINTMNGEGQNWSCKDYDNADYDVIFREFEKIGYVFN